MTIPEVDAHSRMRVVAGVEAVGNDAGTEAEPPDAFRQCGHFLIAWIGRNLSSTEHRHPLQPDPRQRSVSRLPSFPPLAPSPIPAILAEMESFLNAGAIDWCHPRSFDGARRTASPPAILGELLGAALGGPQLRGADDAFVSELSLLTMNWVRQLIGLSDATEAFPCAERWKGTYLALAGARSAATDPTSPMFVPGGGTQLNIFASELAPDFLETIWPASAGIPARVHRLPVDDSLAVSGEALSAAIATLDDSRHGPCVVIGAAGTSAGASDRLLEFAHVCARNRFWFHVDAFDGGGACIAPEIRASLIGMERADSVLVEPARWFGTRGPSAILFSRRGKHLRRGLDGIRGGPVVGPPILSCAIEPADIPNPFSLWFVLRALGWDGLAEGVRERVRLAKLMASWIDASPSFERMGPVQLDTVCFRARADLGLDDLDELNADLVERLDEEADITIGMSTLHGRQVLCFTVSDAQTQEQDVRRAWAVIRQALRDVLADETAVHAPGRLMRPSR